MKNLSKFGILIPTAFVFIMFSLNTSVNAEEPGCFDLLKLINSKPTHLLFDSCEKTKESQLRVLTAKYSVKGDLAESVETTLNERFKMPLLKFVCCGWSNDNGYGSFTHRKYNVSVRMFSEESLIQSREDWSNIYKFYVTTTLYLDEP